MMFFRIVTLSALLALPSAVAAKGGEGHSGHHHDADHGHAHAHGLHEAEAPIPQLQVQVLRDAAGGWNLRLRVDNFRFTPEAVNQTHQPGTGHAHVYINGEKHGRIYGAWHHLAPLGPGRHQLRVSLNTNDHREYAHQGRPIEQVVFVEE